MIHKDESGAKKEPTFKLSTGVELSNNYYIKLGSTERKVEYNTIARSLTYNVDELATEYCKNSIINTPAYYNGVHKVFTRGFI